MCSLLFDFGSNLKPIECEAFSERQRVTSLLLPASRTVVSDYAISRFHSLS
jgi:hypothetical protein